MNNYTNLRKCVDRLKSDYAKHGNLLIAFDFDSTLFDLEEDGLDMQPVIDLALRCQKAGMIMCLWTACTDDWSLAYKKRIVKDMGLNFQYINASPALNQSRKPHFSILLDDRAGLASAFEILTITLNELEL